MVVGGQKSRERKQEKGAGGLQTTVEPVHCAWKSKLSLKGNGKLPNMLSRGVT